MTSVAGTRKSASASFSDRVFSRIASVPASLMGPRLGLILVVVLLCVFGLVMVYSSSSIRAYYVEEDSTYYFSRQCAFMVLGIVVCIGVSLFSYERLANPIIALVLWLVTCALLVLALSSLGASENGAARAIAMPGITLQPAELAKPFLMLSIASLLISYREGQLGFRPFIIMFCLSIILPVLLIYKQPDLGTAIIVIVGIVTLLLLWGCPYKCIAILIGVAVAYVVFVCITQPYHIDRILTMIDPWRDEYGDGRQSIQSQYAFGKGGIFGVGLGLSRQKYMYLSDCHTDFIFSIIGEECGLIGALFVVVLFVLFVFFGLRISRMAPDLFGCMIAGACTVMIGFQACVNMGQACGVLPVTGKALPFMSYGGSSLLASFVMVGLILSVSIHSKPGAAHDRRRDNLVVLEGGSGLGRGGTGRGGSGSGGGMGAGRGVLQVIPGGRSSRKDSVAGDAGSQTASRTKRAGSRSRQSGSSQRAAQRAGFATRKKTFDASSPKKKASGHRRTRSADTAGDPGSSGRLSYPGRDMSGRYASRTGSRTDSSQRHRDDE